MHILSTKSLDGNLETLVLALLEHEDSYGYALNEALREQSEGSISLKEGTLYPLLHRMEKHGWIQFYWQEGTGRRKRKYYSLTDSGRSLLNERRAEWKQLKQVYRNLVEGGSFPASRKPAAKPKTKRPPAETAQEETPVAASVMDEDPLPDWLL